MIGLILMIISVVAMGLATHGLGMGPGGIPLWGLLVGHAAFLVGLALLARSLTKEFAD